MIKMDAIVNNMYDNNANNAEFCKMCPLCNNRVRFFYLAIDEKILMCENIKCEFPFGYNDFKIIKEEDDMFEMSQRSTNTSLKSWPDIDRNDLENLNDVKCFNVNHEDSNIKVIEDKIASEKKMVKELNALKGLTKKFNEIEEDSEEIIKNKNFIRKLMKLQKLSGVQLVKQEEMDVLRRDKPGYKSDDLKIDIDTSTNNLCAIKIEITQNKIVPNVT
ncbi:PREDICTED: uncharacterized protein LOC106122279 [Papilio xuthus]|uniref:Uncharacterized protein LOC106122279 n=1 Tax=Papilio xuthus TaxID=66420 RepID=A0AAJ7EE45_PAPXU|nr:PREDICTED: uncharacterized protein LOC106122279 [Papilio xuthus]